jgi:Cof subfamily protein (haloacid dehalogenase superfamily)
MMSSPPRFSRELPIRMIAIDIDGTLLPTRGAVVSDRNKQALRAAEAAGIEIVIATGRRQAFAMPILAGVGLRPETIVISSNGSITRNFVGDLLERSLLGIEMARELCGVLRPFGSTVMTFDREGKGSLVIESYETLHERIQLWVDANRASLLEVVPLERALDGGECPVQAMVCGTMASMRQAEETLAASSLAKDFEMHRTAYPARDLCIVDILPLGCSKGRALEKLARQRGLERGQVMAIGDNFNDIEMLEYAGTPAVMANSAPELVEMARERGWMVTGTNDEDGVAQVIDSLLVTAVLANRIRA